jgi:tetratricopeptide (TPR) repeat protein
MRGSLDRALSRIDEVLKMADGDFQLGAEYLMYSPCTLLLIMRSVALTEMGRPLEARRDIEKAIEASKSRNEVIAETLANSFAVNCAALAGDFQGALNYGRECLQIAENLGVDQLLAIGHSALGRGELVNEQFEKAVENLDRGLRISVDRQVNRYAEGWSRAQLANALLGLGEASRAHHEAERAVEICNQQGLKGFECLALQALALALLRLKGADAQSEIEAHLARAKALADEGKFWGHYPYILQVRAELAALLGDDAARRRHLSEARSLFAKMGAQGHVDRVDRELKR